MKLPNPLTLQKHELQHGTASLLDLDTVSWHFNEKNHISTKKRHKIVVE
jgi:hypothetical protein